MMPSPVKALGVQEEARRFAVDVQGRDGVGLQLRVGLNSGEVIAGQPRVVVAPPVDAGVCN
jgi:class 3 adenylate cyclase